MNEIDAYTSHGYKPNLSGIDLIILYKFSASFWGSNLCHSVYLRTNRERGSCPQLLALTVRPLEILECSVCGLKLIKFHSSLLVYQTEGVFDQNLNKRLLNTQIIRKV